MQKYPRFKKISEFFNYLQKLNESQPVTEEQILRDIELSERGDYTALAEVKGKGSIRAQLPDLSAPLSLAYVEAGVATVEGFGSAKISFEQSFSDTPTLLAVPFGFFELKIPWVEIEWRSFTIAWWEIRLPVPRLTTLTIRLPSLCFMMNVSKDGFEVFNVIGRTTISYFAFGR